MVALNKKAERSVNWALERFYSAKELKPVRSLEDYRVSNALAREIRLKDKRVLLMSDKALDYLRRMVSVVHAANVFDGLASYGDLYEACKAVLADLLSDCKQPDNAQELVGLMRSRLSLEIDEWTFAVPITGVTLVGIDCVHLGALKIVSASPEYLDAAGVDHKHAGVAKTIEATRARHWLVGSARGTAAVARETFRSQAELAVGMLAISTASIYEGGAEGFRIRIAMSSEEAHGTAGWFSWENRKKSLISHFAMPRGQQLELSDDHLRRVKEGGVFDESFAIFESPRRTPLEEAVTKAVYWYADAQREEVPVMKLVKYWSCAETFFSADNKDITRSISLGIASVLVFGDYRFVPRNEYDQIKRRVAVLYDHRSRALHRASHHHVSTRDTAELSQWIAWMLLNMIAFVLRGYTKVEQIKEVSERLDRQMNAKK